MTTSKIYNLVIMHPVTGATISNHVSDKGLLFTKKEMLDLAERAVANGYQAKVWDLAELEPLFEG